MLKLLVILFVLSICSCSSINQQFINSVDSYTKTILPEYKEYVKNDPSLDTTTQRIRIQTADTFQALVDSAKSFVADDKKVESEKPIEDKAKVEKEKPIENKEKPVGDSKKVGDKKPVEKEEKAVVDSKKEDKEKPIEKKEDVVGDIAKIEKEKTVVDSVKSVEEEKNNE